MHKIVSIYCILCHCTAHRFGYAHLVRSGNEQLHARVSELKAALQTFLAGVHASLHPGLARRVEGSAGLESGKQSEFALVLVHVGPP